MSIGRFLSVYQTGGYKRRMEKKNGSKEEKENSTVKCPNCDEENMKYDTSKHLWQCLSCGHRIEE
jgi:ribosomal protein L37AE/L43A